MHISAHWNFAPESAPERRQEQSNTRPLQEHIAITTTPVSVLACYFHAVNCISFPLLLLVIVSWSCLHCLLWLVQIRVKGDVGFVLHLVSLLRKRCDRLESGQHGDSNALGGELRTNTGAYDKGIIYCHSC